MKTIFEVDTQRISSIQEIPKDISKAYHQSLFDYREEQDDDAYQAEQRFLNFVRNGDIEGMRALTKNMSTMFMVPQYTKNSIRQAQFMMCVTITLLTRAAIEGGLQPSAALLLSDVYMRQVDKFQSSKDMAPLTKVAALDFTTKVNEANRDPGKSHLIKKSKEYIFDHLHESISLKDIAEHCNVSREYLSTRFKIETGQTVIKFIRNKKLKTARKMLENSDYQIHEIAYYLGFPSHSSFSCAFNQIYSITPKQYREQYLLKRSH
ncbi:MAG: AraC family transcriptional regulator [Treponema sp.]|nr:AraC family transcriptional regulator [Treponema sp.]